MAAGYRNNNLNNLCNLWRNIAFVPFVPFAVSILRESAFNAEAQRSMALGLRLAEYLYEFHDATSNSQ
ncbi:hypothetical protein JOD20_005101 [Herpetosiphon giganteus]|nr:hypothetical protein [Herpetosiphon giganteus]